MSKKAILSLLFVIITVISYAQVTFGLKAGVNLSMFNPDYTITDLEPDYKYRRTPHFGIITDFNFSGKKVFGTVYRIGINFISKGTKYDLKANLSNGEEVSGYNKIIVNYIEAPITAIYSLERAKVKLGPYFAYGISGINKYDYEYTLDGNVIYSAIGERKYEFSAYSDDQSVYLQIPRFDAGIQIGVEYSVGSSKNLSLELYRGYKNLTPKDPDNIVNNSDFKVTNVGFNFSLIYFLN